MRPVDKGAAPTVTYTDYREAAPELILRLGRFCSYCERQIETHLAVEHCRPKSLVPSLRTVWSNFLLGCVNCNSCKGDTAVNLSEYFWPDSDNTIRAFEYSKAGLVNAHSALTTPEKSKAEATIQLVGLDRYPGSPAGKPTSADKRWERRQKVWALARRCVSKLASNNSLEVRELIIEVALGRGMFSIWWTAFSGDADMRRRLREAFVGTDPTSFDAGENPVARPGGQL